MRNQLALSQDYTWQRLASLVAAFVLAFAAYGAGAVSVAQPADAAVSIRSDGGSQHQFTVKSVRNGVTTTLTMFPGYMATSWTRSGSWGYVRSFCIPSGWRGTVTAGTQRTYGPGCYTPPTTSTWTIKVHR